MSDRRKTKAELLQALKELRQEVARLKAVEAECLGLKQKMTGQEAEDEQPQELLRSIIDATPDWIFIKDQEHRYRLANQGYAEALHLKPEDFIGKNDLELGFPEELVKGDPEKGIRGFWADDRLVMDSGETQIYPNDPATIDDEVHVFHTIKTPLRDADGEIWGVLAFARDITEVKQTEEAVREGEERYRRLFEDSPISLWEEDFSVIKAYTDRLRSEGVTDFRTFFDQHPEVVLEYANLAEVVDVNPTTLKLYQAADKAEFFNGLGQIFGSESLETFKEEMIAVAEGQTRFAGESIHYTLTGEKVYVTLSWSVAPGYENDYSKVVVSMIDITEREQGRELLAKRAAELGAVAEVSTAATTILETDKLLQEVADLTKERFELYHAHLYLLNEAGDSLNLTAGAGEVGRQMVAEGWSIPLEREQSLVARAARLRQGVIVNDVQTEPGFLPNPLLPETRSEMAVPLIVGERVLGVLDVQADEVNHFTEEDVRIQTTLAAQVAVAWQNAQSYEQTRQASLLLQERVKELDCLNEVGREIEESPAIPGLLQWVTERIPPAMRYPELCQVAIEYDDQVYGVPEAIDRPTQMAHGLYIGGELLGRIYIAYTDKRDFLDEESALLGGIATRLSSYIENQRLFAEVQERATELEETTTFLDSILENIPTMLFVKDAEDLRFVRWNRAGEDLIGYSREDLIGKNDYDFFPKEEADYFTTKDREVLTGGKLVDIPEEPINTLHQGTRILHTRKIPIYGQDGKPKYLLGISVDITDQKQAEAERERLLVELREALGSADRFRQFVETSTQGIGWANLEGEVIYVNPTLCRLFGEDQPEDIYGNSVAIYYPEETQRRLQEEIFPAVIQEGRWVGELPIASMDGRTIPTFNTLFLVRDDQGQPLYLGNLLTDITERKQAEEELREAQEQTQAILEAVTVPMIISRVPDGTIIYANDPHSRFFSIPRDELIGQPTRNFFEDPAEREKFVSLLRSQGFVNDYEVQVRKSNGELTWVLVSSRLFNFRGETATITIMTDITERKQAEAERERLLAELEETTGFLDSVIDNLPVMIFVKEAKELRHVRWNKTGLELIGRPPEEMIGKNDYDFFPKEEAEFFEAKDRETLEKGELVEIPEEPIQTANGDIRWLYTRKTPVYGADGQARYLLGISVDITERKQADQEREQLLVELREALGTADRFRQFVETSAQGIGWANLEGDVIYVNPTLCRLFGEDKPEDIYGKSVAIYYPEETQRRLQEEIFPTVIQEGRWVGELPIASKDGRTIPTFNTLFLVRDDQGQPLYLGNLLTDITEQKQAEAERERLLAEVEATYRQYVEQEWQQFLGEQHRGQWRIEHASLAVEPGGNGNNKAAIEAPIALRGQQIGSLRLEDLDAARQWTAEEKALVEAVSQQLAQTVENLRLFDETQQRATREQLTREITDRMRAAPDIDSIMQIGVEELARVLGGSHTVVELNLETEDR